MASHIRFGCSAQTHDICSVNKHWALANARFQTDWLTLAQISFTLTFVFVWLLFPSFSSSVWISFLAFLNSLSSHQLCFICFGIRSILCAFIEDYVCALKSAAFDYVCVSVRRYIRLDKSLNKGTTRSIHTNNKYCAFLLFFPLFLVHLLVFASFSSLRLEIRTLHITFITTHLTVWWTAYICEMFCP